MPIQALEQALDIDMVSAACPNCHILLVQANNVGTASLNAATKEAARLHPTTIAITFSIVCGTAAQCKLSKPAYTHPGIPITSAAGDGGYRITFPYPAAFSNVIAVGGTVLHRASNARGWSEEVWPHGGSGCSEEEKPAWQTDPGCAGRTLSDVAAVAENASYYYPGGWLRGEGTSESSPIIAGILAQANSYTRSLGPEAFYRNPSMLFDVTSGKNGECGTTFEYLCTGEVGYDGPTGMGTPNGIPEVPEG
jgi:subtilase family serine protease